MDVLWNFEISITLFLQSLGDWLQYPMKAITSLGNEDFYILFLPAFYWCINSWVGLRILFVLMISGGINTSLKFLFHSPRPFWFDPSVKAFASETSFGLPSGHAQNAVPFWGTLAIHAKKKMVTILALVLILLIGLSRIYLGVHFLRDVLTGWLIGGLILWIYSKVEHKIAARIQNKSLPYQIGTIFLFSISIVVIGLISRAVSLNWVFPREWAQAALQKTGESPNPLDPSGLATLAGVTFGFLSGFAWRFRKFGEIKVEGPLTQRFMRYFVGIIGVVILYLGLHSIFPEEPLVLGFFLRFIRYALIGIWISAIAPALFVKLRLQKQEARKKI
ncbi:MAG: phosphatase PAP2 family protein [Chloroflexi bacterium]|nr:phosphatase PAP2 family protein [Chloroflexota bacterium]